MGSKNATESDVARIAPLFAAVNNGEQ